MKTLILVRHAKSSWDNETLNDFDRPLNDRGKKDAPEMAQRLKKKEATIQQFISSPAKRAKKTARIFAETYDLTKDDVKLVDELYLATREAFLKAITEANDSAATIAVFAHNPGITEFASSLTEVRLDNMPTCGIFAVKAETDKWKNFETATKQFLFFDFPKNGD